MSCCTKLRSLSISGSLSTNEKRREQEVHRWIGVVPAVPVLVIRESVKSEVADLLVDLCSTLTYAHELWAKE